MKVPWLTREVAPTLLETAQFRLRPLRLSDLIKDYDAVMMSRREIYDVFGRGTDWPPGDLTIEQDAVDLGWHQKEFQLNLSFTFMAESLDRSQYLGCVYIMPPEKGGFDAQCIYWVKTGTGLDELLGEAVRRWLKESWSWWPRVAFPGRDITWNDWEQLSGPTNAQS